VSDLLQTMSVGGSVTQTIGYTADGRMASFSPTSAALADTEEILTTLIR
jgi:hypothetical protein